MTNTETVRAFIDAWNAGDVDAIVSFLDDGMSLSRFRSNRPWPPGRGAVHPELGSIGPRRLATAVDHDGPKVLTERIDAFVINGRTVSLPVMGTFEIRGGKITAWRDYFDLATYVNKLQPASPG